MCIIILCTHNIILWTPVNKITVNYHYARRREERVYCVYYLYMRLCVARYSAVRTLVLYILDIYRCSSSQSGHYIIIQTLFFFFWQTVDGFMKRGENRYWQKIKINYNRLLSVYVYIVVVVVLWCASWVFLFSLTHENSRANRLRERSRLFAINHFFTSAQIRILHNIVHYVILLYYVLRAPNSRSAHIEVNWFRNLRHAEKSAAATI